MESRIRRTRSRPRLPTEIWLSIFTYLSFTDLQETNLVCQYWRQLAIAAGLHKRSKLIVTNNNINHLYDYLLVTDEFVCRGLEVVTLRLEHGRLLQKIFHYLGPQVRYLKLHRIPLTATFEKDLSFYMPNVEVLDLNTPASMPDYNVCSFTKLKSLHLNTSDCYNEFPMTLVHLYDLKNSVKLEELRFNNVSSPETEDLLLDILSSQAKYLKRVSVAASFIHKIECYTKWYLLWKEFTCLESLKFETIYKMKPSFITVMIEYLSANLPMKDFQIKVQECCVNFHERIIRKWPRTLKTLTFHALNFMPTAHVYLMVALHCNLQCVELSGEKHITEHFVCLLATALPNLRELNLSFCDFAVTNKSLGYIFKYQTRLRSLMLNCCTSFTDEGLYGHDKPSWPIGRLRGLQKLCLSNCSITDISIVRAFNFIELRSLDLSWNSHISSEGIFILLEQCPAIEHLNVRWCKRLSYEEMSGIYTPRLKSFDYDNCDY